MHIDLVTLIETIGYAGVFAMIFAESGLFFGFFFPGDSLLLTAGLLSSRGVLNIRILVPGLFVAAVVGDSVGYLFGAKTAPRLFSRPDSFFFRRENLLKAQAFYARHGGKTVTLARFLPVIRTFVLIVAGATEMHYGQFLAYNAIGGLCWAVGMSMLGFYLGSRFNSVAGVDRYFTILVLAFFVIPGIPAVVHLVQTTDRRELGARLQRLLSRNRPKRL